MKLAIFGDSFGSYVEDHFALRPDSFSWAKSLRCQHDATIFSNSGTSLYWSYQKFTEHQHKYDKIIFVAGINNRRKLNLSKSEIKIKDENIDDYLSITPSLLDKSHPMHANYKDWYNKNTYVGWNKIYKTLRGYYTYIYDNTQNFYYSRLMVNDVQSFPNTLVIPAFRTTYRDYANNEKNYLNYDCDISLLDIQCLEFDYWGVDHTEQGHKYIDTRHGHITDDNNRILYHKIQNWLNTGEFSMLKEDFITPSRPMTFYYKERQR